ncbi:hypothetical protein L1049_008843 [Liquidambar formosana]|uniref:Uncharacterized protein n=1 Tax=Liquidambar formosana TaxID=63359 RepID=A0AAP0S466_LIQFO
MAQTVRVNKDVYCSPETVNLVIVRKFKNMNYDNFVVKDATGNLVFEVKGTLCTMHGRQVLLDAAGNPLANSQEKICSAHNKCQVFKGDSSDPKDLLFTAKRYSILTFDKEVEVFLPNNKAKESCDFKVKWGNDSCIFTAGEFTQIAKMHRKHNCASYFLGKHKFMLEVQPNIDHAFIVALVVFLDDIHSGGQDSKGELDISTATMA